MEEMFENWAETKAALLEGLTPEKAKIVAPLLENQKQYLLNETAAAGATAAHDIAGFRKIMIPMIRRIIPGTIATELIGVQPMQGPVGLVYSMRYKYAEAVVAPTPDPWGALPANVDIAAGSEVFGNLPALRSFYSGGAPAVAAAQTAGASGITNPLADEADITGAGSTGSAWPSSLPAFNSSFFNNAGAGWGPTTPGIPGALVAGSLYGGSGSFLEGSGGRKMTLEVVSQAVEAGSRKLQAGWTIEAMQDLKSQHGMDLESEMTQAMSAHIVQEIDSEILRDLIALAGTTATINLANFGASGPVGYQPAYLGDKFANLGVIINAVANEIGRKTRRGVANWIVVSPLLVSVLQSAAKSVFAPAVSGSFKGPNNTMLVGTLNGSIKVYSYLWNQAQGTGVTSGVFQYPGNNAAPGSFVNFGPTGSDFILMGYKGGNGETDTGYFYCPYIPLMSSGVVMNPVTFQPVVSMMTRYGKTAFTTTNTSLGNSSDYYGKITVSGLDFTQ